MSTYGASILLFLILFAFLTCGARQVSLTADEPAHLAVGYAILKQGTSAFGMLPQHGHPPLLNVLAALIFYIEKQHIPVEQLDGWPLWYSSYIHAFAPYLAPAERTAVVIRTPIILLTMVLSAVVFRWGRDLWGEVPGLIALLVLTFDPLLLAHGRLATTDAGTVTLGTLALYSFWRWTEKPSWRLVWMTGILLGCTMLAKFSGTLWALAMSLVVFGMSIKKDPKTALRMLLQGAWMGFLGLFIVWAGHAFTWGPVQGVFHFSLPAPAYWNGMISQMSSLEKLWVFALGIRTHGGWWWYFPLAFMIKNPIPLLAGLIIGLVFCLRMPFSRTRLLTLGLFPLLYTVAAIQSRINIGYRHMLPVHPSIYLVIGAGIWKWLSYTRPRFLRPRPIPATLLGLWHIHGTSLIAGNSLWLWMQRSKMGRCWTLGILGAWYVIGTVRIFPYELAYFNELAGGPYGGYRYLVDSNLDWGQFDRINKAYLQAHPDVLADPPTTPFHPLPGRYLVSASYLQGVGVSDPDTYEWFRHQEPVKRPHYGAFVYEVPPLELDWFAQCEKPAVPLDHTAIVQGTGHSDLREVTFDCTQAWLYPAGAGIYALHHALVRERSFCLPILHCTSPTPFDAFITRHLSQSRLSFERTRYGEWPAFVLYETISPPVIPPPATVYAVRSETPSVISQALQITSGSVHLDGPLVFLGARAYSDDEGLDIETWWQVTEGPITRPLSIMGHLLNGSGELIGQDDGLGISPVVWQPEDIIVQRHRFPHPPAPVQGQPQRLPLQLRTGVYWLDTMERWKVLGSPEANMIVLTFWITN